MNVMHAIASLCRWTQEALLPHRQPTEIRSLGDGQTYLLPAGLAARYPDVFLPDGSDFLMFDPETETETAAYTVQSQAAFQRLEAEGVIRVAASELELLEVHGPVVHVPVAQASSDEDGGEALRRMNDAPRRTL